MRYRVQYEVVTTKVADDKSAKETKTSSRMVDLGEGMAETARSQKVHKAIRDILQVTHVKNQGVEESAVKIVLTGVRRMAKPKPSEVIHDFWIAEPPSTPPMPADPNALLPRRDKDDDEPKREKDEDDTPTEDETDNADEDEEDDWDDDEEEDEPSKPTVNFKPKSTTKKKKSAKK